MERIKPDTFGKDHSDQNFNLIQIGLSFFSFYIPTRIFFKHLDTIFYDFVYNGRPDKIKQKTLILPIDKGGLGMLDCRIFCKVLKNFWIKRFYDKSDDVRWIFFSNARESHGGTLQFQT